MLTTDNRDVNTEHDIMETVNFDKVLEKLGPPFRYQIIQILLTFLYTVPCIFALFNFVFIGYEPPHVCAPTNETELLVKHSLLNDTTAKVVYEMCQIRITSNKTGHPEDVTSTGCISGHIYEGGKDVSMKTEWDLVCERRGVAEIVQTMFVVGSTVGSMGTTFLADRYGRKSVMLITSVVRTITELVVSFSPSIFCVAIMRLLSGIVTSTMLPYILSIEVLAFRQRQIYSIVELIRWSIGVILLGSIAYVFRFNSWRDLQLATSLLGLVPLLLFYLYNESMPWLFARGRHDHALKTITKVCKMNGTSFVEVQVAYHECIERAKKIGHKSDAESRMKVKRYSPLDLVRHRLLRIITVVLALMFLACNMTYYAIFFTSSTLIGNRYFMFMALAGIEIPGTLIVLIMMYYVGRRVIIISFMVMSASCLLVSTCLVSIGTNTNQATTAFFILGKFAISAGYGALFIFAPELFPTSLRSTGVGICSSVSRIGEMIVPFAVPLFQIAPWSPGTIMATLCFISLVLYFSFIPETRGRELPTCIEDIETWVKEKNSGIQSRLTPPDTLNGPKESLLSDGQDKQSHL